MDAIYKNFNLPFIVSLVAAIILTILPLPTWANCWRPEWLTLVVIYWALASPPRISLLGAWVLGLVLDILQNTAIGEHALILTVLVYFITKFQARLNFFTFWQQFAIIIGLIILGRLIEFWLAGMLGQTIPGCLYWLASITTILLWPWIDLLLQYWQKKLNG
jgi:rod shape-determining protein MreD